MFDSEKDEVVNDLAIHNSSSKMYGVTNGSSRMIMPAFTVPIFEDAGKATCTAFLDFIEVNSISRLPKS